MHVYPTVVDGWLLSDIDDKPIPIDVWSVHTTIHSMFELHAQILNDNPGAE
jgi:hypothetical protein